MTNQATTTTATKLSAYIAEHRSMIDGLIAEVIRYRKAVGADISRFEVQERIERLQEVIDREEDSYITAVNVLNDLRRSLAK